ncbi:hypothetical protein B0H14DRAFT_3136159 [Mycena olivaceomarginata]|nr:hypothetical protein B0H14DRAFT_3136159 [Mycena olivaceomarginata]
MTHSAKELSDTGTVQRARSMAYTAWNRTEHEGRSPSGEAEMMVGEQKERFTRQPAFYTALERLIGDVGFALSRSGISHGARRRGRSRESFFLEYQTRAKSLNFSMLMKKFVFSEPDLHRKHRGPNRTIFHLPDGPAQEARDNSMRSAMGEILNGGYSGNNGHRGNANMWADREKTLNSFSYDPDEAVNQWWRGEKSVSLHTQFAKM